MQVSFKQVVAGVALAVASVSSAYAGDFVDVLNTGARTPGSTNNQNTAHSS
ncbi:hypothetical protein [Methylobacillus sp.]|uniref:hypothetical protein n=1 Tax=Methylobacillus sp. TaxID=56818 RepID=UPI002FE1B9A5